jgi:signal peptidase II
VENPGAAFGSFTGLGNNIFIIISIIAIIFISIYLSKIHKKLEFISLSLVLGGAVGNLLDRFQTGKVIDFIDFYVGSWHWPAFNVADSALTVGIILFLISNLTHSHKKD